MSSKHRKVPFVRPPKEGAGIGSYILYVIKIMIATLGTIFSLPFTWIGFLTGALAWLLIFMTAAGGFLYVKVYPEVKHCREVAYDTIAKMKDADFRKVSDTEVYDKDNQLIGVINAGHYEYVDIRDISMNIQNAYIDQEDRRFKTHPGYDWMAIVRAGLAYIKNNGKITQGASTITQQVIKNTYLTQEKTLTRKITEIMLAPELEKKYGKDKIMEFYCNGNFYGHHCYGVQAASRYYFGKDASDVDPWEAALLVGISNSPANYDPVKYPDAAKKKRNEVLASMAECKTITDSEKTAYQAKPLDIVQEYAEGTSENYMTSYAIHCTAQELMKNDGFVFKYTFSSEDDYDAYQEAYTSAYTAKSDAIREGGYRIYTTLDPQIQEIAQTHLDADLKSFTEKGENGKYAMQGAVVVVNNTDGHVVAVVGGRGTDDEFNRAYLAIRQPGSTIKPLLDYAPAFETGEYYPSKVIDDHEWEDGPKNSGGSYYGPITIREGLNRSLNTVAWQVLQGIGRETGLSYLGNLHFQTLTYTDTQADAIAIGGFTNGARVVDMAKGYETLANNGVHDSETCIRSIKTDKSDKDLYADDGLKEQVYSEDTAFMITDVLKGTMDKPYGTGYGLDLTGQQAAGKTGTTNSNKDTWFCGYTKYYTSAVWIGYDTPRAMPGIYGATYAGKIWHDVMTDLHSGLTEQDWVCPSTVIRAPYDPETGTRSDAETETAENSGNGETGEAGKSSSAGSTAAEGTDYFSINADVKKAAAQHERDQKQLAEQAAKDLQAFEDFQITSVKNAYETDDKYQSLMKEISLIEDDSIRADYSKRAVVKNSSLQEIVSGMSDEIEQYRAVRESERESAQAEAAAEAESQREEEAYQIRIDYCREKIAAIRALQYRQDDIAQARYAEAQNALAAITGSSEYNDLSGSLNSAMTAYYALPTKEQWDAAHASRSTAATSPSGTTEYGPGVIVRQPTTAANGPGANLGN